MLDIWSSTLDTRRVNTASSPRSGWRTFGAGMFLYAVLIVVSSLVVRYADPGTTVRVPSPHAFFVFGLGGFVYGFGALFAQRRYR